MSTSWNSQTCRAEKSYKIQFETDEPKLYKLVEEACQKAVDIADMNRRYNSIISNWNTIVVCKHVDDQEGSLPKIFNGAE